MTRGPLPKKAIDAAKTIAATRGILPDEMVPGGCHYDFVFFTSGRTVFVRIKRIRYHIIEPEGIGREFHEAVLWIRKLPDTPVISREIWVLTPWNTWQFFRVLDDRIIEIRQDGTPLMTGIPDPGRDLTGAGRTTTSVRGILSDSPTEVPGEISFMGQAPPIV